MAFSPAWQLGREQWEIEANALDQLGTEPQLEREAADAAWARHRPLQALELWRTCLHVAPIVTNLIEPAGSLGQRRRIG
jgi:hypothetical protein